MFNYLRQIIKPHYQTLNHLEINGQKIIANYSYLQSRQNQAAIWPVLKSNAYGHGLKETASLLNKTATQMVVVDSFPEAQIVYSHFKKKVLILGEMSLEAYHYLNLKRTEVVIYNSRTLRYLSRFGHKIKVHLFVNTGMNREGIKDLESFIIDNKKYLDKVNITGLCSHLASADQESDLNQEQLFKFLKDLTILKKFSYQPLWTHLGNSAALLKLNNPHLNAYRAGLALYGYNPLKNDLEAAKRLKPALELFSQIVSVQNLVSGEKVSYNETYQAQQTETIAVIPFGYFEGLDRRLSNKGIFMLKDSHGQKQQVKIAGRVCMNLTSLKVPLTTKVGDEIQLISSDPQAINSIQTWSKILNTIPYEVLVKLQSNIRREIVYKK